MRRAVAAFNARNRKELLGLMDPEIEYQSLMEQRIYRGLDGMVQYRDDVEGLLQCLYRPPSTGIRPYLRRTGEPVRWAAFPGVEPRNASSAHWCRRASHARGRRFETRRAHRPVSLIRSPIRALGFEDPGPRARSWKQLWKRQRGSGRRCHGYQRSVLGRIQAQGCRSYSVRIPVHGTVIQA
jgi:hypothetical protein